MSKDMIHRSSSSTNVNRTITKVCDNPYDARQGQVHFFDNKFLCSDTYDNSIQDCFTVNKIRYRLFMMMRDGT